MRRREVSRGTTRIDLQDHRAPAAVAGGEAASATLIGSMYCRSSWKVDVR